MQIAFRQLQLEDGPALDDAQRIMALEQFVFAFDYGPGRDLAAYLKQLEDTGSTPTRRYWFPTPPSR